MSDPLRKAPPGCDGSDCGWPCSRCDGAYGKHRVPDCTGKFACVCEVEKLRGKLSDVYIDAGQQRKFAEEEEAAKNRAYSLGWDARNTEVAALTERVELHAAETQAVRKRLAELEADLGQVTHERDEALKGCIRMTDSETALSIENKLLYGLRLLPQTTPHSPASFRALIEETLLAPAVARAREEQRELCANAIVSSVALVENGIIIRAAVASADVCRSAPLAATPLADRIDKADAILATLEPEAKRMEARITKLEAALRQVQNALGDSWAACTCDDHGGTACENCVQAEAALAVAEEALR